VGEEGLDLGIEGFSAAGSRTASDRAPVTAARSRVPRTRARSPRIGVISDTHGLLRPEALAALQGVDHILHAGDIGGDDILRTLRKIAQVTYVRGNNDDDDGHCVLRTTLGGIRIVLTHILPKPTDPRPEIRKLLPSADVVVFGHSHLPHNELIDGVRFFNPASAGPRRFDYPVSIGIIEGDSASHVPLDDRSVTALEKRMNQLGR
jgi:putative phosphoesterase